MEEKFSKYEKARMLGSRALQIAMGAPFLVKLSDADLKKLKYNPLEIAKIEFEKGVIPITVKRPLPKKSEE
jgi:DNA-directed RNA polymerase subunit K